MRRRHLVLTGLAVTTLLGILAGCASSSEVDRIGHVGGRREDPDVRLQPTTGSTTVNVTLSDTCGAAGPMTLTVSPATAPAGDVTFVVKNTGTIEHEAVVLKTQRPRTTSSRSTTAAIHRRPWQDRRRQSQRRRQHRRDRRPEPQTRRHPHVHDQEHDRRQLRHRLQPRRPLRQRHARPFTVHRPTSTVNVTLGDTQRRGRSDDPDGVARHRARRVTSRSWSRTPARSNTKPSCSRPTSRTTSSRSPTAAIHPPQSRPAPTKSAKTPTSARPATPNLKPGDTRTFTIKNMTAGNYVIVCNLAGHYGKGMRAPLHRARTHDDGERDVGRHAGRGRSDDPRRCRPRPRPPGDVTFVVKNTGTIEHEAVVLKTNVPYNKLPVTYGGDPPAPVTDRRRQGRAKTPISARPATPTSNPATPARSRSRT